MQHLRYSRFALSQTRPVAFSNMSPTGSSRRLALRVLKARFCQKKDMVKMQYAKLKKMRSAIQEKEKELDDMEEDRSSTLITVRAFWK